MTTQRAKAVAALLATMFVWGTSAVFLRTTALTLEPENALALRYLILCSLQGLGLALTSQLMIARSDWSRFLVAALGMFASSWFSTQGFARVAAGLGTVIMLVEPIIIALLAYLVLREPLSKRLWLGLAVSVLGAIVLFWPELSESAAQPVDGLGVAALLCACTGWAVYTIGAKPLLLRYSSLAVTAWSMLLSSPLVFLMASKPNGELLWSVPKGTWLEILYLAVFNSILGTMLWNYGVRLLPGTSAGSFLYLIPVVAIAMGYLWLGEAITPFLILGGLMVAAGVALAQSSAVHPR